MILSKRFYIKVLIKQQYTFWQQAKHQQAKHQLSKIFMKKSHTCEKGGSHFRISFWHLLLNLKNNYLLKKLLNWANKKDKNFNVWNVLFINSKEKTPGNIFILHLCTKNLDDMIYSSWDIKNDGLKLIILGHFLPFYALKNPENQNFEKMKNNYQKLQPYWCIVPEIWCKT